MCFIDLCKFPEGWSAQNDDSFANQPIFTYISLYILIFIDIY